MKTRPERWLIVGIVAITAAAVALECLVLLYPAGYLHRLGGELEFRHGRPVFESGIARIDSSWFRKNAKLFHKGDPPCLRYVDPASISPARIAELTGAIEDAGLLELFARHGYFNALFFRWRIERAAAAHPLDEAQEALAAIKRDVGGVHRLLIWLNQQKLIDTLRDTHRTATELTRAAAKQQSALTTEQRRRVRLLWRRFGTETTPLGLLQLAREIRPRVTLARMKRIGRAIGSWTAKHASPPRDLGELVRHAYLTDEQIEDGWRAPVKLEGRGQLIRLLSFADDRRRGGTGRGQDIVRELRLAATPADPPSETERAIGAARGSTH